MNFNNITDELNEINAYKFDEVKLLYIKFCMLYRDFTGNSGKVTYCISGSITHTFLYLD